MKNKLKRSVALSLILTCVFSGTAFARDMEQYNQAKNTYVHSNKLSEGENVSYDVVHGTARSTAMAAAISSIRDGGRGIIKVSASTDMFKPVDWACLTVYLEQWDEESKSWQIVEEYEKEFLPEDEEDGELTSVTVELEYSGHPMGYYYRVRTMHELEFDNGWYEIRVTKTDGILMEYVP